MTTTKEQKRVRKWTNQIEDKKWVTRKPIRKPTWRKLNPMRTGVEWAKDSLKKWGPLKEISSICECGMEQSLKHIIQCQICPYSCTQEDVIKCKWQRQRRSPFLDWNHMSQRSDNLLSFIDIKLFIWLIVYLSTGLYVSTYSFSFYEYIVSFVYNTFISNIVPT